jgi:hypothetical protein
VTSHPVVEDTLVGAKGLGAGELVGRAAGDNRSATEVLCDVEGGESDATADTGDQDGLTGVQSGAVDHHPPRGEVRESEGDRLHGIGLSDGHEVSNRRDESLREAPVGVLADHQDVIRCRVTTGKHRIRLGDGGVEKHPHANP